MTADGFFDLKFTFTCLETDKIRIDYVIRAVITGSMNLRGCVGIEAFLTLL